VFIFFFAIFFILYLVYLFVNIVHLYVFFTVYDMLVTFGSFHFLFCFINK